MKDMWITDSGTTGWRNERSEDHYFISHFSRAGIFLYSELSIKRTPN